MADPRLNATHPIDDPLYGMLFAMIASSPPVPGWNDSVRNTQDNAFELQLLVQEYESTGAIPPFSPSSDVLLCSFVLATSAQLCVEAHRRYLAGSPRPGLRLGSSNNPFNTSHELRLLAPNGQWNRSWYTE